MADITNTLANSDTRLLALVEPGGIGKTRLALAAAAAVKDDFADGVAFVSLAPLKSVEHIPSALAESAAFRFSGAEQPRQQLVNYLRRKQTMLIRPRVWTPGRYGAASWVWPKHWKLLLTCTARISAVSRAQRHRYPHRLRRGRICGLLA